MQNYTLTLFSLLFKSGKSFTALISPKRGGPWMDTSARVLKFQKDMHNFWKSAFIKAVFFLHLKLNCQHFQLISYKVSPHSTHFVKNSPHTTDETSTRRIFPKISSAQIFQAKIFSDQTFQTEICPDQTFQTQVTSDHTFQTQKVSDQTFQTEGVLIRPSSDHGPDNNLDHCPDLNQTMIRLKCARNSLIRERIYLWKKSPNFAIIYLFHKNWCLQYLIHLRKNQL